jgi:hypothetical protein
VITGKKKYWILWFAFLAVPGSGFLRFDGIPFSSKTEFAVLAVSVVGALLPAVRLALGNFVQRRAGLYAQITTLILGCAIVIKLFTFVLLPLGEGFEACYRSIYAPLPSGKCEKSFESPFLNNDLINVQGSITRMEPTINFGSLLGQKSLTGASSTSWKLPFANDFPRLSAPWLDRLPFTANFGTMVNAETRSLIPIEYSGKLSVDVDGKKYAGTSYLSVSTLWVPIHEGDNAIRIFYKFADLEATEVPDVAPTAIGPWAHLFVGEAIPFKQIGDNISIQVSGWTFNQSLSRTSPAIELVTSSNKVLATASTFSRPDVAKQFHNSRLDQSGFSLQTKLSALNDGLNLFNLRTSDTKVSIGKVSIALLPLTGNIYASFAPTNSVEQVSSIDSLNILQKERTPLTPTSMVNPSRAQHALLLLVDGLVLLPLISIFSILLVQLVKRKRDLPLVILAITCSAILARFTLPIPSALVGIPLLTTSALSITSLLILLRKKQSALLLASFAPLMIMVSKAILAVNRQNNGLLDAPWWRFPLWYGRGGDWFVTQGYARTIFVENSLRGGENLFYFQPGVRYFVFLQHLLLGENDVLLQMLIAIGFLTLIVMVARNLLSTAGDIPRKIAVYFFVAAAFSMVMSFEMIGFAVVQASEYPTWLLTFLIFGIVMTGKITPRSAIALSALCALIPQFRPNQIFGALCLFILLQFEVAEGTSKLQILHRIRMVIVFGVVLSLSLFHNLYYAASFTLFSASGTINADFTFVDLIHVLHDSEFRNFVIDKLRIALWWRNVGVNTTQLSFWTFQLIWLLALIRTVFVRSTSIRIWIALALPFAYLVPLLPYKYESYWPRHIVIIQIAFALSGLFVINRLGPIRRHENHQDIEVTPSSSV